MLDLVGVRNFSKPEDFKSKSSSDISLSSNKAKVKSPANSYSDEANKTLDKKSDFKKEVDKFSRSEDNVNNEKPKSYQQPINQKNEASKSNKAGKEESPNESYQVPAYEQNPFFSAQAAMPIRVKEEKNPDDILSKIDIAKVSSENKPVVQFMKSLHEYFKISPQKLMQAFGEIPPQSLMLSPREAMDSLFQKLELQPGQYTKAQIMFNEMMTDLEKASRLQENKELQLRPSILSDVRNQNIKSELPLINPSPLQGNPSNIKMNPSVDTTLDQMIRQRIINGNNPIASFQSPSLDFSSPSNLVVDQSVMSKEPVFDLNYLKELSETQDGSDLADLLALKQNQSPDKAASLEQLFGDIKIDSNKENFENLNSDQDLSQFFGMDQKADLSKMDISGKMTLDLGQPNQKINDQNIQQLISKAQTMAEKGGGEMKIQLKPEGLGQIHLKIKVQDGQVGIQMIAESHEAKKLFENSIDDLKLALNDHKLKIDNIKVDVSDKMAQDTLQQDFKREDAREFLNQFRQYNESFRQGFADNSQLIKNYRKVGAPQSENIRPVEQKEEKRNANGRLHLVA